MSELLPCPFCGGQAIYVTHTHYYDDEDTVCVFCNGCKAHVILEQNEAEGINEKTKAEAVDAWNTRAERTCRIVKTWSDSDYVDDWNYRCSECRGFIPVNERNPETGDVISAANYCPNCGCKVVSE